MSKATAAKLTILIFLAFIICLPEFFPSDPVAQIQFHCLPFDLCDSMSDHAHKDPKICEVFENIIQNNQLCAMQPKKHTLNQSNTLQDWFLCETQVNLWDFYDHASNSGVDAEVVLMLQGAHQSLQNVTTLGHLNHSGLQIETHWNFTLLNCCSQLPRDCTKPNKTNTKFLKGLSTPRPSSHSSPTTSAELSAETLSEETHSTFNPICRSNRSQCLFHFVENILLNIPNKEVKWWGAAVWLILVLIVVLVVLLSVGVQVYASKRLLQRRSMPVPVTATRMIFAKRKTKSLGDLPDVSISIWSTEDEDLFLKKMPKDYTRAERRTDHFQFSKKIHLVCEDIMYKQGLSPIHEVSMTDIYLRENEEEKSLDVTVGEGESEESLNHPQAPAHTQSLPCLHHLGHPSLKEDEESMLDN
ncbi:uncharacterized protein si:dkey-192k22.2 [Hoplias malabaricus]|uniref:uncharacterized protein si:dkey-192k22.2 n=1 Tax=Hoplias malabaricus TaxID=27720 RepID=UPI00346360CA